MTTYHISLGKDCSTTAYCRLQDNAVIGPFDWNYINFDDIIHHFNTRFKDYLQYENFIYCDRQILRNTELELPFAAYDIKYFSYYPHTILEKTEEAFVEYKNKISSRIKTMYDLFDDPNNEFVFVRSMHTSIWNDALSEMSMDGFYPQEDEYGWIQQFNYCMSRQHPHLKYEIKILDNSMTDQIITDYVDAKGISFPKQN